METVYLRDIDAGTLYQWRKSSDVTGLIIQELPAIVRPQMRTYVDEIDGRNGDIVTELGWSAYDRQIKIGLHGSDIQSVIEAVNTFFKRTGEVRFSNEPNKWQYYTIQDSIDFERLIRYRTATVTLHCQPEKYYFGNEYADTDRGEDLLVLSTSNQTVTNAGDIDALPRLSGRIASGDSTLEWYIDDRLVMTLNKPTSAVMLFNIDLMTGKSTIQYGTTTVSANRYITGNLSDMAVSAGNHTMRIDGTGVTMNISRFNRWIV